MNLDIDFNFSEDESIDKTNRYYVFRRINDNNDVEYIGTIGFKRKAKPLLCLSILHATNPKLQSYPINISNCGDGEEIFIIPLSPEKGLLMKNGGDPEVIDNSYPFMRID